MSKFYPKKDKDAWDSYPHLRSYFNKLDLSLKLEYVAGPAGTPVPHDGEYIIRPIYNLSGLSANTQIVTLKEGFAWSLFLTLLCTYLCVIACRFVGYQVLRCFTEATSLT